jgi:Gluconate 2-dehydrogenase subunit 3
MHRRELLSVIGAAAVLPLLPRSAEAAATFGERLHARLTTDSGFRTFDAGQAALVSRLADDILPRTDTPGALDVLVPQFVDLLYTDWASDDERKLLLDGLAEIDTTSQRLGGEPFVRLADNSHQEMLRVLDKQRSDKSGMGYAFGQIKALTVYGYFTSERVQKDVLKTRMFFTHFDGNAPV